MSQLNETESLLVATLLVFDNEDNSQSVRMQDGTSMIVGNDATCGLKLESQEVASKHCVLRFEDGQLGVCDWYSDSGTFVNGMRIENEATIGQGDELQVGNFRIKVVFGHESAARSETPAAAESAPPQTPAATTASTPVVGLLLDEPAATCDSSQSVQRLQRQLDDANAEIRQLREELQYQLSLAGTDDLSDPYHLENAHSDEIELLRVEVAHLQSELADRDREVAELLDGGILDAGITAASESTVDAAETEQLVDRLDQLLDELQSADQRVLSLEELLRCSEEVSQAEREERVQLESWVEEIESRVVERENEWLAKQELLENKVSEVARQRDVAQQRLAQSMNRSGGTQAEAESHVQQLQQDNNRLNDQLTDAQQKLCELQQRAAQSDADGETLSAEQLRQQMRQQELELAKERAEIARQKSELVKMREEMERGTGSTQNPDENPDVRIRALRDHLREIHEEEKEEKRQRSLSARISRLWQRLEGH